MNRIGALSAVLIVSTALAACKKDEKAEAPPRPVKTVAVGNIDATSLLIQTGEIAARNETDLGFQIDGRLISRLVGVGAKVSQGDVIAVLDDTLVSNELRSAEADLAAAISALDLAKLNLGRQQSLFDKNIIAKAKLDEAVANTRSAEARFASAQSVLANAKKRQAFSRLTAPTDGVVTVVGANEGQVVSAGQMVVRIASAGEKEAVFNVAERIVNTVPDDVRVKVALVSDPEIVTEGRVREVSPIADQATRTYRVRIALRNPPEQMALGAAVRGTVEISDGPLVRLPSSALTRDGDRAAVYVIDPGTQKTVRKPVTVARFTDAELFISSGLSAGDRVVVAGVQTLRPDQRVLLGKE